MLRDRIDPEFVEFVPEVLEPGVLYISMKYATASHLCACGCGEKVVTPFTPTDWRMTFDGETVSLSPSVGNWEQGCFTHYVIDRNRIIEHGSWTPEQIEQGIRSERAAKARFYGRPGALVGEAATPAVRPRRGFWASLTRLFR